MNFPPITRPTTVSWEASMHSDTVFAPPGVQIPPGGVAIGQLIGTTGKAITEVHLAVAYDYPVDLYDDLRVGHRAKRIRPHRIEWGGARDIDGTTDVEQPEPAVEGVPAGIGQLGLMAQPSQASSAEDDAARQGQFSRSMSVRTFDAAGFRVFVRNLNEVPITASVTYRQGTT